MITRAKLSAVRANSLSLQNNLQRSVNFDVTVSASGVRRLFEGGAY